MLARENRGVSSWRGRDSRGECLHRHLGAPARRCCSVCCTLLNSWSKQYDILNRGAREDCNFPLAFHGFLLRLSPPPHEYRVSLSLQVTSKSAEIPLLSCLPSPSLSIATATIATSTPHIGVRVVTRLLELETLIQLPPAVRMMEGCDMLKEICIM